MVPGQQIFALGSTDLRALLEEFLVERAADRECSPRTLGWYRATIGLFVRLLSDSGNALEIADVGPAHLLAFRLFLQRRERWPSTYRPNRRSGPLSDAPRRTYDRALRVFFKWAYAAEYIAADPKRQDSDDEASGRLSGPSLLTTDVGV